MKVYQAIARKLAAIKACRKSSNSAKATGIRVTAYYYPLLNIIRVRVNGHPAIPVVCHWEVEGERVPAQVEQAIAAVIRSARGGL